MGTNGRTVLALILALVFAWTAGTARAEQAPPVKPVVQIAILLDTSNSMDGLIDQARAQLWKVVNEFATARKNGVRPDLSVALYEYGNDSIPAGEGHIRLVLPLTTDLDRVSEALFALSTNGGSEYCGMVIRSAVQGLAWSKRGDDLKAIFIAGNEPFTQGGVDYRTACKDAIAKSIMVNTIFCGSYDEGVSSSWQDGSALADGSYMNIDQNRQAVHIAAPQDDEIRRLGLELNGTYVAFGALGGEARKRQAAQDANAAGAAPESAVQRAVAKASDNYRNDAWDLVDAEKAGAVALDEVPAEALPEEMRGMTAEEQKAYLEQMAAKREALQSKIKELNGARKEFVEAKQKELAAEGVDTLDGAMIKTLREQAAAKAFEFTE